MIISGCQINGNKSLTHGGGMYLVSSKPVISECTIVGNRAAAHGGGIFVDDRADVSVSNSIIRGNSSAQAGDQIAMVHWTPNNVIWCHIRFFYSNLQDGGDGIDIGPMGGGTIHWQEGNIDVAALFADPGGWDDNGTPADESDDTWIEGDYHLKSYAGRWDPMQEAWVNDDVHSPCIDAGDPAADYSAEPAYNGDRINMGAYAGTQYASKTPNCPEPPTGDLDGDCRVTFADLALFAGSWQDCNLQPEIACQ